MPVTINPLGPPFDFTGAAGSGSGDVTHTGTLTAHEVILGNGGADIKALGSVGSLGQVLTSGGAGVDPSWQPGGSGTIGGTIAATQVAFGTGADTIGGEADLTYISGTGQLINAGPLRIGAAEDPTAQIELQGTTVASTTYNVALAANMTVTSAADNASTVLQAYYLDARVNVEHNSGTTSGHDFTNYVHVAAGKSTTGYVGEYFGQVITGPGTIDLHQGASFESNYNATQVGPAMSINFEAPNLSAGAALTSTFYYLNMANLSATTTGGAKGPINYGAGKFVVDSAGEITVNGTPVVKGTISSTQVAFGTGADTIGGDADLTWDNTAKKLTLTSAAAMDSLAELHSVSAIDSQPVYISSTQTGGGYVIGVESDALVTTTNTAAAYSYAAFGSADAATVDKGLGYYVYAPETDNGGVFTSYIGFWSDALGGLATNAYSFWSDEAGVFRIRSDNTFNGVYQAIPALYNPQFTKYTPGAANYERIVFQWESNVGTLTTEKGGTGTLRNLNLAGATVTLNGVDVTTVASDAQTLAWLGL